MAKHITEEQLSVLRLLVAGKTFSQIQEETGVSIRTIARWKARFSGLLAESDDAIASMIVEARVQSAGLLSSALDELGRLLRTAEEPQDKLSAIDRIFRAHQLLNPAPTVGSVTVEPENSFGQVIVQLPHNGREVPKR